MTEEKIKIEDLLKKSDKISFYQKTNGKKYFCIFKKQNKDKWMLNNKYSYNKEDMYDLLNEYCPEQTFSGIDTKVTFYKNGKIFTYVRT